MLPIVLASTSPFRAALLAKLEVPFSHCAPDLDEAPLPGEKPLALVRRLSEAKARKVAEQFPAHLVIASDQLALFNDKAIGKPGNHAAAVAQLEGFSGHCVTFLTGLALLNTTTGSLQVGIEPFKVHFRHLEAAQIEHYLRREQPYQCAGSFKSEGLGITLFERLEGDDPNTLIGLPLIRLCDFLRNEGIHLPLPPV